MVHDLLFHFFFDHSTCDGNGFLDGSGDLNILIDGEFLLDEDLLSVVFVDGFPETGLLSDMLGLIY